MSTFKEKPPVVKLLNAPEDPLSTIYEVWCRAKNLPHMEGWTTAKQREAEVKLFRRLIYDYTQITEMVSFCWWIEGVPRAHFDQVVRHRKTSMFARSQRVELGLEEFATRQDYLTTPEISEHGARRLVYRRVMRQIQQGYQELRQLGTPVEDARGILPLHLRTGFAWGTTLRDMADVFRSRTCVLLQQTYWAPVMNQMRDHMLEIDEELGIIFKPPCERPEGGCVSTHDAELRARAVIDDSREDLHPCKIWAEEFADAAVANALRTAVHKGRTRWAKGFEESV